ncbi:MAG TPA: tetratricopeptide repeat protein [Terriglobia bacterium]|nr:tetratricopeptide repeat protein [Terriglobia bacterium]
MKQKCFKLLVFLLATAGTLRAVPPRVILVFPLENLSGNSNLGWMSEGITSLLGSRLNSPTRYVLQRDERNDAYKKLGLTPEVPLTLASEYEVAQTLGANVAVVGSFTLDGEQLTTRVQWLDVLELKLSQPVAVSGKLNDLADLETQVAWKLVTLYDQGETAGSEETFSHRFPPVRLDAFENYIRGVLATDAKSRIQFLRESERLDPSDHRAAFELGRYYFEQKDYASSARWLQAVKATDEDYSESLFLSGIDQHYLGHDVLAESAFGKLSKQVPLPAVMNNLGVVELSLNHYDHALSSFQEAYKGNPSSPAVLYNMGGCFWYLQKYDQAAQYLRKSLLQESDDADTHAFLAHVLGKLGDVQARQSELQWVAAHGENNLDDPVAASDVTAGFKPRLRIMKKYDGRAFRLLALAIRRATESRLSQQPAQVVQSDGQIHMQRGMGALAAGRLPEAEKELTEAVSLLPGNSEARRALGQVYEMEGKHTLAATELEASLNEKDSVQAHLWLARAYLSLHHPGAAMKQAQAVLRSDSANTEAEHLLDQIRKQSSADRGAP